MPNFSIGPEIKKSHLTADINKIEYIKLGHQPHFNHLKNMMLTLKKQHGVNFPKQQMLILGAVFFTLARIEEEYRFRDPKNSEFYCTLLALPHIQSLNQADDADLAKSFALSAFNQWYNETAFDNQEGNINRIKANPLCKNSDEYTTFENILKKVTQGLPEVKTEHFDNLYTQMHTKKKMPATISACGYSLEKTSSLDATGQTASTTSNRSWGQFLADRPVIGAALSLTNTVATATGLNFWSEAAPKELQNEPKAQADTVNTPTA